MVRYLPWPLRDREESLEHTVTRAGFTRLENDHDALILAMELVGAEGAPGPVIGDLSVFLESAEHAQIEIGWVLHPGYQGRGFALEGARALLEFAFAEIGAHRVMARLSPENSASVALCGRLGMRREALFVESEIFKGEWSDLAIYAILRREWDAAR